MTNRPIYGPHNLHPLSQMRTELVWEGKYDDYGNRRELDVAGLAMPLQKIETIDQPRSEAAAAGQLDMFEKKSPRRDDFRNRLIWGDNKLVMASLLKEFKGKIDLIYIDPPFDVGADFTMEVPIGEGKQGVNKEQSILEMVAYRDMWGRGTDSYLHIIFERLALLKELLTERGSIFVHIDYRVSGYVRCIMDEVFARENLVNEIIWQKCNTKNYTSGSLSNIHDTILFYAKSRAFRLNEIFEDLSPEYIDNAYRHIDESGRRYRLLPLHAPGRRGGATGGEWKGMRPLEGNHWRFHPDTMTAMDAKGLITVSKTGVPAYRKYLEDSEGVRIGTIWLDAKQLPDSEKVDYPTQKPESILEKVVRIGSNEGDLVADLYCGSGTTGAVAERLGRRWLMADLGRFAIHTTRKRLIELQRKLHAEGESYRAFDVYNLGRYERQWWQKERLKGADDEHRRVVLEFFRAEQLTKAPSPLIHGRKYGAFCHVDGIDSIFTREEAKEVAKAVAAAGGKECYALAWEFEMDLRMTLAALEQELGVKLKPVLIPREIMEKNLRSPPPFFEMAVVEAEAVVRKSNGDRAVDVKLTKFLPSLAEVPSKELEAIRERAARSGFDFIDFWAVDFDWHPGKPFNHHWQDYRTRKDRSLKTVSDAGHVYPKRGRYTACVKVVDTFGSDTSITVPVEV